MQKYLYISQRFGCLSIFIHRHPFQLFPEFFVNLLIQPFSFCLIAFLKFLFKTLHFVAFQHDAESLFTLTPFLEILGSAIIRDNQHLLLVSRNIIITRIALHVKHYFFRILSIYSILLCFIVFCCKIDTKINHVRRDLSGKEN